MEEFRVGIIGCGRPRRAEGATGFGQGHVHAAGYKASADCEIVAAADIRQDNLDAFVVEHHVPRGYLDYREFPEFTAIMEIPIWYAYVPILASLLLLIVACVLTIVDVIRAAGSRGRRRAVSQ